MVGGKAVQTMTDDSLSDFRARHLGFIFQSFNLLPVLTAFENVEYPLVMAGIPSTSRRARVDELLEAVGLGCTRAQTARATLGRSASACGDCTCAGSEAPNRAR